MEKVRSIYAVQVFGPEGRESETTATDYTHALSVCRVMGSAEPGKYVRLVNLARINGAAGDWDGLTEEEHDESREVVIAAQAREVN